jgi:hypothetical protein
MVEVELLKARLRDERGFEMRDYVGGERLAEHLKVRATLKRKPKGKGVFQS